MQPLKVMQSHPLKPFYGKVKIGDVALESGDLLSSVELAYERIGNPNAPILLICHALTGNQRSVGEDDGWWNGFVGYGSYIDTRDYQVITFNVLGGCDGSTGPTSVNPLSGKKYQTDFPSVTIRDIARTYVQGLRKLGIHKVKAAIGGSLGGMQVLELGYLFPAVFERLISLAATPKLSDYALAYNFIGRKAITSDPAWNQGRYSQSKQTLNGLAIARMIGMVTYRTPTLFNETFNREEKAGWGAGPAEPAFQIDSYLDHQGEKLSQRFDANSYLYLLKAMDSHDLGRGRGGWQQAIQQIQAPILGVGFTGDLLYPVESIEEMMTTHQRYSSHSAFIEVKTKYGHDGFLVEFEKWGHYVKEWLNGD